MTNTQWELPKIKRKAGGGGVGGQGGDEVFSFTKQGLWQLDMSLVSAFLSPLLFIPLIGLFFLICLLSPSPFFFWQRKWPWRVGRLRAEPSQSRFEKRGRRSKTSCWISDCMRLLCVCACVRAPAGGCQHRLAWHRSRFQRLPRKWGGNDSANSVLKTDRESDFGELTTTLAKDRLSRSYRYFFFLLLFLLWEFGEMTWTSVENW